jgi:hypothetical protein
LRWFTWTNFFHHDHSSSLPLFFYLCFHFIRNGSSLLLSLLCFCLLTLNRSPEPPKCFSFQIMVTLNKQIYISDNKFPQRPYLCKRR